jgi:neprilysin
LVVSSKFYRFIFFQLDQLVLALPSRDYYLKASSAGDLRAYHKYMTQIALLLGADPETAFDELDDVVKFEIKLANVGTKF